MFLTQVGAEIMVRRTSNAKVRRMQARREAQNQKKGTSLAMDSLVGIVWSDWWRLLVQNRFVIDPRYWHKAVYLTIRSAYNSKLRRTEERLFGEQIRDTNVAAPPVFVLGHWRSGTTFLHNLLCQDPRFAYPTLLDMYNPHSFIHLQKKVERILEKAPSQKRPMDNVVVTYKSPAEDEFALAILSLESPLLGWTFPRRVHVYDRYLTFRNVNGQERRRWEEAFLLLVKKLTLKYGGKQLLLKSPTHTGRIELLLKLFPNARFIHIHRNPYDVFKSTRKLYDTAVIPAQAQKPANGWDPVDRILRQYVEIYDAFFEQKDQIPPGKLTEVAFEELEREPIKVVRQIYDTLGLGDFDQAEPHVREYLSSVSSYKKNVHRELPPELKEAVARAWKRNFEMWGYPI